MKVQKYSKDTNSYEIIDNNIELKCILLGKSTVGKTTFFNYFNNLNKNDENDKIPISTSGSDYLKFYAEYNNRQFYVNLYDTAGNL